MDETKKEYIRYAIIVLAVIACAIAAWFLFRDIRTEPATDQRVEKRLGDIEEQQQQTKRDIDSIKQSTADSQRSAENIDASIDRSTASAENIERAESDAAAAIDNAEDAAGNITEQSARIAEENSRTEGRIADAENANTTAAAAITNAGDICEQCRELNRSSEQIFARCEKGN